MISDLVLIDSINRELAEKYRVLDGRPIYRIVWSADQLEVRRGLTREYYGHIFLREYMTVGEREKYWYFLKPCWVLEKLTFVPRLSTLKEIIEELPNCANGSYEPLYKFADKDSNPLPVNRFVVEFVLFCTQNPIKRNWSDWMEMQRREESEEVKYFEEEIAADERSPLFVFENSEFISTNQMEYRNGRCIDSDFGSTSKTQREQTSHPDVLRDPAMQGS
jgi:hypothetical protein